METFRAKGCAVVERRVVRLGLAAAPACAGLVLLVLAVPLASAALGATGAVVTWCGFFALLATGRNPEPRLERVSIVADPTGVYADGRKLASRGEIVRAYLQPDGASASVVLEAFGATHELLVPDERTGRAFLAAIGQDTFQAPATFGEVFLESPGSATRACVSLVRTLLVSFGFILAATLLLRPSVLAFPLILGAQIALVLLRDGPLVAKMDETGLRLEKPGKPGLFVPYGDILRIHETRDAAHVHRRGGPPVVVRFVQKRYPGAPIPEVAAFVARLRSGLAAFAPDAERREVCALVTRGPRPLSEWLTSLDRLGGAGADAYRAFVVPRHHLWSIVEDAAVATGARAGAAVALRRAFDHRDRERLRAIAASCASADLAALLETLADGGDDGEIARGMGAWGSA